MSNGAQTKHSYLSYPSLGQVGGTTCPSCCCCISAWCYCRSTLCCCCCCFEEPECLLKMEARRASAAAAAAAAATLCCCRRHSSHCCRCCSCCCWGFQPSFTKKLIAMEHMLASTTKTIQKSKNCSRALHKLRKTSSLSQSSRMARRVHMPWKM